MAEFRLGKVRQVAINIHDLERAVTFYRDTLGLTHRFSTPSMAFFDGGSLDLLLSLPESEEDDHTSSIIYFDIEDIQAGYQELQARGVEFVSPPHVIAEMENTVVWMAFFRDSEGNILSLMSDVPR